MTDHHTVQVRRELVNKLWSWGEPAEKILQEVRDKFPKEKMTINMIYQDIEYLKELGNEYIERRFIPQFGQTFLKSITNVEEYARLMRVQYTEGTTKTTTTKYPGGDEKVEVVKQSHDIAALRLAYDCEMYPMNIVEAAPVLQQMVRLKERCDLLKKEQITNAET